MNHSSVHLIDEPPRITTQEANAARMAALEAEIARLRAGLQDMRPLTNPIGHYNGCTGGPRCYCGAGDFNDRGQDLREMIDALLNEALLHG